MRRRSILAAALNALPAAQAVAQGSRPVRLVVAGPPGGGIDGLSRLYAPRLAARMAQNWVVENRPGGNNTIGAAEVARSAPDGQTFLANADIHLMATRTVRNLPYDPMTDFTPIGRKAMVGVVIVGHPQTSRARTLEELAESMRRDPGRYAFATSGGGSQAHLVAEAVKRRFGAPDALIVHYRGAAPALNDVVAGNVPLTVAPMLAALPLIQAGRLRAFAITAPRRSSAAPDIRTVDEAGYADLHFAWWSALWAPRGLPQQVAETIARHIREIGEEPEMIQRLAAMGAEPVTTDTPARFAAFLSTENERYGQLADLAGIQPE